MKSHLRDLIDIEHKQLIPIEEAISKYKEVRDISNSDRWIRESIKHGIGDVLMMQTVKNKWVCSKERLEYSDVDLILKFGMHEIPRLLSCENKPN